MKKTPVKVFFSSLQLVITYSSYSCTFRFH